jgi:enoyl-CoA hydratase/carnithine racemase
MAEGASAPDRPPVLLAVEGGVAIITLNRPDDLNVYSAAMGEQLSAAYVECDQRDEVRVVVLTGAGRAFCAGADMRPDASSFGAVKRGFSAQPLDRPAWELRKPVIAAVNGHAIGIGFTLAMQCDIRVVALDAKLATPQVRRGVLGDAGSHWTLPHMASWNAATELLLMGRTILGDEALRLGVATRVAPAAEVLAVAVEIADEIAVNCSPVSLAMSKRLLWSQAGLERTVLLETAYHEVVMGGPDAAEGPLAWMQRRPPQWQGTVSGAWEQVQRAEALSED